jgi:uncharacterized membrane protein YfcA
MLAFLASLLAGGFGSMVGIGGGLIIVPVLTLALGVDIKVAIAASLIGVIATSTTATATYLRAGLADRRLGLFLLVATAAGGVTGGITAGLLDGRTLAGIFGLFLLLVAVQMSRQRGVEEPRSADGTTPAELVSTYIEPRTGQEIPYRARRLGPAALASLVAGNVSGLLGVGGGIINVPTMNLMMGVPIRVATTTSTYMLGATAAASALIYYAAGLLDPVLAGPVALGVFIGARGGAFVAGLVSHEVLRYAFILVALVFAVQMLLRWSQTG